MELLEIENLDYEAKFIEVLFDGMLKEGFYVTTEYDFDIEQIEYEDDRTGQQDYYEATNISFWDFKIFDADENEISFNDRETKKVKELIEFKLIDLLEDEINNN